MTEEQKKLYQYLYSIIENEVYKDCLRKQKKSYIEKQKDSDFMEYSLVEAHLRRISQRNNDRAVPIETTTLNEYNQKTGSNLENVKIMYGAYSDELTRAYHATALTIGATIYFSTKAYKPETEEGRKTLAHELTHVQQNKDDILEGQKSKEELEKEAEQVEKIIEYNPEKYREINFEGKKYKLTEREYRELMDEIRKRVEHQLEYNTMGLSDAEYLKVLIQYQEMERRRELIWQK